MGGFVSTEKCGIECGFVMAILRRFWDCKSVVGSFLAKIGEKSKQKIGVRWDALTGGRDGDRLCGIASVLARGVG